MLTKVQTRTQGEKIMFGSFVCMFVILTAYETETSESSTRPHGLSVKSTKPTVHKADQNKDCREG